jgi:hypothetical protein
MDEQIQKLMKNLSITEEQARQVIADDKAIDRGEKLFELTDEQKKIAKKMTITDEHKKKVKTAYKFDKRERKKNASKSAIIAEIAQFLTENSVNACENVTITNEERQIAFTLGENSYELTLVQKRQPKK